jgi:uncharacterized protein YjiS (DUF1127 family)
MGIASTLTLSRPFTALAHFGGRVSSLVLTVEVAMQVRRERRALGTLSNAALKDLGLNKATAQREAERSFWDVPVDRLRV